MRIKECIRGQSRAGFTLVELMVVVAVIAILAAMSTPTLTRSMRRADARNSANEMAQLLRTARTQAMSRGEIVLLRLDAGSATAFATMSAAPNTIIGDLNSPVMRSCRLLTDFDQGLANPHADDSGGPIGKRFWALENLIDPNVAIFDVGAGNVRDLCFSPDGRVYDGGTTLPVSLDCGGAAGTRGFVMVLGREPAQNARALPNLLSGGTIDPVCPAPGQEAEVSVALDNVYAHVIEVSHNGTVTMD